MDRLFSVREAADRLGVSFWTVYRLARRGELTSIRVGRRRLFAIQDLEKLIAAARGTEGVPGRAHEPARES